MSAASECDPEQWPPGTVKLEDANTVTDPTDFRPFQGGEIILQPRPTVDPNDPLNWAPWRKYLNFGLACMYVVFVFADINAVTPTWGPMNEQNGFSYELLNDSYAAGCAALAIGGPLLIPFALKYGRRPVYVFSTIAQFAIAIWTAKLQTVGDLVAVNTLNCLFGALSEIIVQMTVADVFFVHQRGRMNSYYIWFLNIGGSLAPLAAGYITTGQGWRWVWWWMAIFFGISFLIYAFMFEETKYSSKVYHGTDPLALPEPMSPDQQDTKDDSKTSDSKTVETGVGPSTDIYSTANEIDHTIPMRTYRQRLALWSTSPGSFSKFALHSYQPLVMFFTIPAVFYISLVYSIINATITVMITVLSEYLYEPPYNFNSAQVGLMSLPPFIATSLSLLVAGPLSDWSILYLAKRNNGVYEPEMRLWVIAAFIPFIPAGLWMFGFGLANSRPWPLLAIGYGLLSFGTAPISSISLTYLTDAYTDIVADSMVTITVTRNIVATVFVFATAPWIDGIGMKNVFVMLGVLMIVIICSVFVFIYCGKKIRVRTASRYRYYAGRQFDTRTFEDLKD